MVFNKLVRDKIPELIKQEGYTPKIRVLNDAEYLEALDQKLLEEVAEYNASKSIEELADLSQVVEAICAARGYPIQKLLAIKTAKRKQRGGFDGRIFLISKEK